MKHLGDITKINGGEIEPVDVIIGGSPCQDLSIAGSREGLKGKRSGLFMEQIRIVKEMRNADEQRGRTDIFTRPRFMVWENVPGAFSSNGGEDFRTVLEEIIRIKEPEFSVPRPEKGWRTAGLILGNGFSVGWRVLDAQYWGVPQRRRRIALVADFAGGRAGTILFDADGVPRDYPKGRKEGERTPGDPSGGTRKTVWCLQGNGIDRADTAGCNGKGWKEGVSYTLNTIDRPAVCAVENHGIDGRYRIAESIETLSKHNGTGGGNTPMVLCTGNG